MGQGWLWMEKITNGGLLLAKPFQDAVIVTNPH